MAKRKAKKRGKQGSKRGPKSASSTAKPSAPPRKRVRSPSGTAGPSRTLASETATLDAHSISKNIHLTRIETVLVEADGSKRESSRVSWTAESEPNRPPRLDLRENFDDYETDPGYDNAAEVEVELTVKADGYVTGRTDTLNLFNGMTLTPDPTFGSDLLGNLSPATSLGFLRGGDATGDNQVDIADANLIFSLWNQTPADADYISAADINADGVINTLDLGFVTSNFGNDGFGAAPVFKRINEAGDNSAASVEVLGVDEVDAWWPGRVFEVTTRVTGMSDVMAYDLSISYDPERVKLVSSTQAVVEGDVFADNARGTLFFQRSEPGLVEVTAGRVGREMTASGDADLVTVRFVTLADEPGMIEVVSGQLVNSAYQGVDMRVKRAQALPDIAALHQNFPNPFNPSTEIRFDIPTARTVKLRVFNQLGQTVRTLVESRMKAGSYRIKWDGKTEAGQGVSSGVYFYSLEAGDYSQIRKMTLVK